MFVMKIEYVLEVLRTHFLKKASAKGFETDAFIHHDDIIQVSLIQSPGNYQPAATGSKYLS